MSACGAKVSGELAQQPDSYTKVLITGGFFYSVVNMAVNMHVGIGMCEHVHTGGGGVPMS